MQVNLRPKFLFILGGICPTPYALDDLVKSKFDQSIYDKILEIDYEPFLDERYDWIPFYKRMKLVDKHGDWWQFNFRPKVRQAIRDYITWTINKFKEDEFEVHVLAHSLGTWALLGSEVRIEKAFLFGSPMGSRSWIVRNSVNFELKNAFSKFSCKELFYGYNKHDSVSSKTPNVGFLQKFTKRLILKEISKGHDLKNYLDKHKEDE
jgi:hypothetical protein